MDVEPAVVQVIYGLSSATSLLIGYVVWRHREKAGALPLLGSICAGWWWATALLLASFVSDYTVSLWLTNSVYLGVGGVVAAIFLFALEYTGREHLVTRWAVALLSIQPLVVVVLAFTNPSGLFYESVTADPSSATGVVVDFGLAFWLHTLYSYALLTVGTAFIVGMLYRSRAIYRGQVIVLVMALAAPTVGNVTGLLGVISFDGTPVGFVVANALFAVAITRYHLIDLSPIARDRVVDEISDAVFVVDSEHRLIDANTAGERMLELTVGRADVVGDSFDELLAVAPDAREQYHELVDERTDRELEVQVGPRHFSVNATPLDDGRGRHVGWLFLVRDVTARQEREAELRRRNEQLDQFASVVSHDLRNPLGIAKGYVDLVEETGELELLEEVDEAHRRMEAIIEDVLALAREGTTVTDPEPVGLRTAAERAWGNVDTAAGELRVADEVTVTADPDRLGRLLENLFRNAFEHGVAGEPAGNDSPSITVEVGALEDGFYVEDDGVGIPVDERDRVFETGYSGGSGTGFGLSIVAQIADVHGWTVSVGEGRSGGARFEFTGARVADGG